MHTLIKVKTLKLLLGESARHQGRPLYEAIVEEARQRGMAGTSVTRGCMGFGASSLVRTSKILRLSEDLPITIEIVDTPERVDHFLPVAEAMMSEGCIVVGEAQAVFHLPLRIRDVMTADVATVAPTAPLGNVIELLLHRGVKAVPVMHGREVVGIITGGDLLARGGMPLSIDMQCSLPADMRDAFVRCLDFKDLLARDVMSSPVRTVNIKTSLEDAVQLMAKNNVKRLPVVADDGSLMGIVSRADVLRAMGRASAVAGHLDVLPDSMRNSARDLMHTDVPTAAAETPLSDILNMIVASPLRRVVIVDGERRVLGIVHDRDLLNHVARANAPGILAGLIGALSRRDDRDQGVSGVARDIMSTRIIIVRGHLSLSGVIQALNEHRIKRVVVADEQGRLLGMIDRDTVLKVLAGV